MKKHAIITSLAALALVGAPGFARAQAPSQGSAAAATSQQSTPHGVNHADALAALQDARVTLARLTESSLPQNARDALARVSTDFRALYKAYTGEEPTPEKSAMQASKQPDPAWEKSYDALSASLARVMGTAPSTGSAAIGTSGTTGTSATSAGSTATGVRSELTTAARQDFEALRQQLRRFDMAAGGQSPATGTAK